jgi:hexosaminidase
MRQWLIGLMISCFVVLLLSMAASREPSLIPQPVSMTATTPSSHGKSTFRFTQDTRVAATGEAKTEAVALIETLAPAMGFRLTLVDDAPADGGGVTLALDAGLREKLGREGYTLEVEPERIAIRATEPAGLFYGVQTLRQLLPAAVFGPRTAEDVDWTAPCLQITDYPRFGWRGLLIDPARHFIPKADLLRFIDVMAAHKFNRLQIHLTDDQGWRIEIKKHPPLTEIGAKMDYSRKGGGFYTQEDIREIVRYAQARHITIVPEIEMPAHTGAAIVSYPRIGLDPEPIEKLPPEQRWNKIKHVLAPRPETVSFMQDVLTEVMDLFPSPYIHIGGDEANTAFWAENEEMQALMRRLELADVHQLHSWFIKQMDAFLTKHGRRLVGWDEILQGGLAEGATVMSWRGMKDGITAARAGHDVVMAPTSHTYFDYYQGEKESEPRAIGGFLPVETVYEFEPIPSELTAEQARHVLGGQGQLWGEFIPDRPHREYMAFPRACALSEVLWSPRGNRDFSRFLIRLRPHLERLETAGVNYRPLDPPFDYFENNWNVVGLKDYSHGSRITPDNELLLAGRTPVQIRIGPNRTPLSRAHGKRAMHGWMPIILVNAADGPVRYEVAFWATPLPDVKDWRKAFDWPTEGENFLNWIRVKATNTSAGEVAANVEIGPDNRIEPAKFPQEQAEPKIAKAPTRKRSWSWRLEPGASTESVARYPFSPLEDSTAYDREDPRVWLERTVDYWQNVRDRAARIEVPCRKATEALLAAHVCQLIANDHGEVHGGEDFYDVFYIRDGAYQVMELEEAGFTDAAAKAIELYLKRQRPDGRFESQENQFDANGQAVWTLWQYYRITGDRSFLERAYPQMLRAVRWTMQARRKAAADSPYAGLLPTAPADGECLWDGKHHIVGYDLWNLRGMLCTADAARILGKTHEAEELMAEAEAYRAAFDAAWKRTGLAHFPPSWEKRGTHWGNTETLWPTELFDRDDPRVAALIRHVREEFAGGFIEGTIQWKGPGDVEAIHPYMGAYTTMSDLVRGRHEQVVEDFCWYLLHSTAAHAFPEGVYYKKRMAWSDTIPHVTGACNFAILLRHMLIHEAGDELHLLAAVPDWWLGEGQEIRVERAPTHFGEMSLVVSGTREGVKVQLEPPKRNPPKRIALHLPPSRPLIGSLEGVEIVRRSNQEKRWDFPTVVALYKKTFDWTKPDAVSLTTGKPVACSHALPAYPARLANDGRSGDTDGYWATDVQQHPGEAWWRVDLEKPTTVGRVVVVGYYGDRRFYGFTVETSLDGKEWEMVADRRDNKEPSTAQGYVCRFEPRQARFIRVTQTHNSANPGRHLVEVMAFEK